jgi:hypothetical protein
VVAALVAVNFVFIGETPTNQALTSSLTQIEWVAVIGMIFITIIFAVMLSYRLRQLMGKLFVLQFLKPLQPLYQRLSDAFGAYRYRYGALLLAFGVGITTALLTGLVDIAIVAGLHGDIAPIYIFLLNPIIAVALIVPISIGGLGTGSVLYIGFYGLVGVPYELAFALSLVKQAVIYLGSLPGGGMLWLRRQEKKTTDAVMVETNFSS